MGQKVNPVLFRLSNSSFNQSLWHAGMRGYPHVISQDRELKSFFKNILRTKGVLLRSFLLTRSSNKIDIYLDLYFSYVLSKQAKFLWARSLFKRMKLQYPKVSRIREVKSFAVAQDGSSRPKMYQIGRKRRKKNFLLRFSGKSLKKDSSFSYKTRFFFFLVLKDRILGIKEENKLLGVVRKSKETFLKPSMIRLSSQKFRRFFVLKKFRYNFKSYFSKKYSCDLDSMGQISLLEMNKYLCKTVQRFCGLEEISIHLYSSQLNFLSSFKLYRKKIWKELFVFQRNRDLDKHFLEVLECIYFVTRTFGSGNAYLLSSILVSLLESIKKQMVVVKFLKKCLFVCFNNISQSDLVVSGIKIMIKGRFNKRRRTKKIVLQEGLISLQTLDAPIDYYQTEAVTIYGMFGIKVWISKRRI